MTSISNRCLYLEQYKYLSYQYNTSLNKVKKDYWKWQLDEVIVKLSIINWLSKECWEY